MLKLFSLCDNGDGARRRKCCCAVDIFPNRDWQERKRGVEADYFRRRGDPDYSGEPSGGDFLPVGSVAEKLLKRVKKTNGEKFRMMGIAWRSRFC